MVRFCVDVKVKDRLTGWQGEAASTWQAADPTGNRCASRNKPKPTTPLQDVASLPGVHRLLRVPPQNDRLTTSGLLSYRLPAAVTAWVLERSCYRPVLVRRNRVLSLFPFPAVSDFCSMLVWGRWNLETWHRETWQLGTILQELTSRDLFQCSSRCSLQVCLIRGVLYELIIGFMFVVLFLSVLLIATCGRLSWPALWSTFGRTIK